ncbi:hypothetical protein [Burkholderia cenocepacia]|uniref:hypothetical protein n=1 Tax=Burkholderia cenocepacia TaxID=95486 RepID=UPI00223108EA|nr:hypothetical protein [Burkholderia cenocepacia]
MIGTLIARVARAVRNSRLSREDALKQEWIERCAKRYVDRAGLDLAMARDFADACWEMRLSDDDSPEDMADEDMTYWGD